MRLGSAYIDQLGAKATTDFYSFIYLFFFDPTLSSGYINTQLLSMATYGLLIHVFVILSQNNKKKIV